MRRAPLTVVRSGIDRTRPKGGAKADGVFDLVNAKITSQHGLEPREGTFRVADLPPGTVGLTAWNGKFQVFASEAVDLSSFPDFELNILRPPLATSELVAIHFAEPFLGALYVVAEFLDEYNGELIYHYWLEPGEPWAASTAYSVNEFVTPTTPNGYVYRATRYGDPYPAWSPGAPRTAGNGSSIDPSRIEPTEYNEFYYEAIETEGDNPRSGTVEPEWPTSDGATIVENTDGFPGQSNVAPPTPPAPNTPQASTVERYE